MHYTLGEKAFSAEYFLGHTKKICGDIIKKKRDALDTPGKESVIKRYTVAIMTNFQLWLSDIKTECRSLSARYAGHENHRDEARDNHVGQLRDFYEQFERGMVEEIGSEYALATRNQRKKIEEKRAKARQEKYIGLWMLTLIACCEHSSHIFMPLFAQFEHEMNHAISVYVACHSEVDFLHAKLMEEGLQAEYDMGYKDAQIIIEDARKTFLALFGAIMGDMGE